MPKESKKFINPLLRPSQEVETKADLPVRVQKTPGESVFIEAPIAPDLVSQSILDRVSSEQVRGKSVSADDISTSSSTDTSTLTDTSTSISIDAMEKLKQKKGRSEEQRDDIASVAQASASFFAPTVLEPEKNNLEDTLSSPRPGVVVSPIVSSELQDKILAEPKYTSTSTETFPETSTLSARKAEQKPDQDISVMQAKQEVVQPSEVIIQAEQEVTPSALATDKPIYKGVKERPAFTASEAVRRKRGPLAFENTHERITLWIDKGLKQGFEELASERELPKTALLNEAIADLLRKYDLQ